MALPYPTKVVLPFDIATAQDMNERHANDVALANGSGLDDGAVPASKINFASFTDANGWKVYDYGNFNKYMKRLSGSYSIPANGGLALGVQTPPVGVSLSAATHFIEVSLEALTQREVFMTNSNTAGDDINFNLKNTAAVPVSGTWATTVTITSK